MNKKHSKLFVGAATALVTPFDHGKIDYFSLEKMIEFQIESGISALVVCGTTGEPATLSLDEYADCVKFAVSQAAGRIPIIVGCGSNSTQKAIYLSKIACDMGADALLSITPYYNKANSNGLIRHFYEIANASEKPVILYNVPSRTGLNIPLEVYLKLQEHPQIYGVKEASGNVADITLLTAKCREDFYIYSGSDELILPILSIGGSGVISVISNIIPGTISNICKLFFSGDTDGARHLQRSIMDLTKAMFCEVNPIPIKYAMSLMNYCSDELRLPLCAPTDAAKTLIKKTLEQNALI